MNAAFQLHLNSLLEGIRTAGLWKEERRIAGTQDAVIRLEDGREVINMCANNYLGLAHHPEIECAAREALERWGYGMASVRFICGTQSLHQELEKALSNFLGTEDTILYTSCFDANGGLFETLLTDQDAVISDALNHASIIDGIRLCKAKRFRYANGNMAELEAQLQAADAAGARFKLIATDGAFSMDGVVAPLREICSLADKFQAMVMVDDSHAVGFMGEGGRGTHEHAGVMGRVDIITGTLGKALGGASGGYASGRREIIDLLRQRSRPYLFSNTVAPAIVAGSLKALEIVQRSGELRQRLWDNTRLWCRLLRDGGFEVHEGRHPIVPVMLGDAKIAQEMARRLLDRGVYAIGFFYPVVPQGAARVRTQVSAAHAPELLEKAAAAFVEARREITGR
ncbi:MAG: glycine C-acetyltransferase [Verrucomicrobiales bacterium]|nr:glycine C-acetyltransferase [Verrucomicrobiales bacterium]